MGHVHVFGNSGALGGTVVVCPAYSNETLVFQATLSELTEKLAEIAFQLFKAVQKEW
jgi:hypothetical protein